MPAEKLFTEGERLAKRGYVEDGITVWLEPSIYLVGHQIIDDDELNRFLEDHEAETWETDTDIAGQKLSEVAGRLCYMSFAKPRPGGNAGYLKHIIEVGHGSVLEHAVFNFIITGVSRSFTHELVRHRVGTSFSQLSQRYVDEGDCAFVEPAEIAADPELHDSFIEYLKTVRKVYTHWADVMQENVRRKYPMMEKTDQWKMARQTARACLPNCTETKIFLSMNVRAIRHFLVLRASKAADDEIRRVAMEMYRIVNKQAPHFFADFKLVNDSGKRVLHTDQVKV